MQNPLLSYLRDRTVWSYPLSTHLVSRVIITLLLSVMICGAFSTELMAQCGTRTLNIPVTANDYNASNDISILFEPANGTATVNADGSIDYTPDEDWSTTNVNEMFVYRVCEQGNTTNCQNIDVILQSGNGGTFIACEDYIQVPVSSGPVAIDVLANDFEADPSSLNIVLFPISGRAQVSNGQIIYTPRSGFQGIIEFNYSVESAVSNQISTQKIIVIVGNPDIFVATRDCYYLDCTDPCAFDGRDADNDGVCGNEDICPGGDDRVDSDNDGTPNDCDVCPFSATDDSDGDTVCDDVDVCPGGDDRIDSDNDGNPNFCDICPFSATDDSDGDTVCDNVDVCPGGDDREDDDNDDVPNDCDICAGGNDNIDSDNDGTPNDCDSCPFSATNDSDNDGVCDNEDVCLGGNDNIDSDNDGTPDFCDDCPNSATDDSDNDGVCDDVDCNPNNPNLPRPAGTSCNDGDNTTVNDVILADGCTCAGTFDACAASGGDSDGDGVCDDDDCAADDANLPTTAGSSCDDGDANTVDDVIQADGCTCAGVAVATDPDPLPEPCEVGILISDVICDDNDTTTDPSDDSYSFVVTTIATNATGATYAGSYNNPFQGAFAFIGTYGEPITLGPFPAHPFEAPNVDPPTIVDDLDIRVSVTDNNDPTCSANTLVEAPATCSNDIVEPAECVCPQEFNPVCGADGVTYNNSCEAECEGVIWTQGGCPIPPIVRFEEVTLCNIDTFKYETALGDEQGASLTQLPMHGTATEVPFNPLLFHGFAFEYIPDAGYVGNDTLVLTITDASLVFGIPDQQTNIFYIFTITECEEEPVECSINAEISNIECNDNDTASDPSDDTFTFTVLATNNTGAGSFIGEASTDGFASLFFGTYGEPITLGPFPTHPESGNFTYNVNVSITDSLDNTCTFATLVESVASCSPEPPEGLSCCHYTMDIPFTDGIAIFPDGTQSNDITEIIVNGEVLPLDYPHSAFNLGALVADLESLGISAAWQQTVYPPGVIVFGGTNELFIGNELGEVESITVVDGGLVEITPSACCATTTCANPLDNLPPFGTCNSVTAYLYNGQEVFFVEPCGLIADGLSVLYACDGGEICRFGGIVGNTGEGCPGFPEDATLQEVLVDCSTCNDCICPDVFEPVCGEDGITYGNSCEAECEGVAWTQGECEPVGCICPAVFDPVCGEDGVTYGNSCEAECEGVAWTQGECEVDTTEEPPCQIGQPCDDGDDCTINDILNANCTCRGTFDIINCGDGEEEPEPEDCQIGQPCDDGNPCTVNDFYNANCTCRGTLTDVDCDSSEEPTFADCENTRLEICASPVESVIIDPDFCAFEIGTNYEIIEVKSNYIANQKNLLSDGTVEFISAPAFVGLDVVEITACNDDNVCSKFFVDMTVSITGICDEEEIEEEVCEVIQVRCVDIFLYEPITNGSGNTLYRFKVTNNCTSELEYAAFEIPRNTTAVAPIDDTFYTGQIGTYLVENTARRPFNSIKFTNTLDYGINNGESETFEYVYTERMDRIRVSVQTEDRRYSTTFNTDCEADCQDRDQDGICNIDDDCPDDPNKSEPGACGCGEVDTDDDANGIADCLNQEECEIEGPYCLAPITPMEICPDFCQIGDDYYISYAASTGGNVTFIARSNCIVYLALPTYAGDDQVSIEACDMEGRCQTVTVDVTVQLNCDEQGGKTSTTANPSLRGLQVAPNPATDMTEISFDVFDTQSTIEVFDITGQLIHQEKLPQQTGRVAHELQVGRFAKGMYLIVVTTPYGTETMKFTK